MARNRRNNPEQDNLGRLEALLQGNQNNDQAGNQAAQANESSERSTRRRGRGSRRQAEQASTQAPAQPAQAPAQPAAPQRQRRSENDQPEVSSAQPAAPASTQQSRERVSQLTNRNQGFGYFQERIKRPASSMALNQIQTAFDLLEFQTEPCALRVAGFESHAVKQALTAVLGNLNTDFNFSNVVEHSRAIIEQKGVERFLFEDVLELADADNQNINESLERLPMATRYNLSDTMGEILQICANPRFAAEIKAIRAKKELTALEQGKRIARVLSKGYTNDQINSIVHGQQPNVAPMSTPKQPQVQPLTPPAASSQPTVQPLTPPATPTAPQVASLTPPAASTKPAESAAPAPAIQSLTPPSAPAASTEPAVSVAPIPPVPTTASVAHTPLSDAEIQAKVMASPEFQAMQQQMEQMREQLAQVLELKKQADEQAAAEKEALKRELAEAKAAKAAREEATRKAEEEARRKEVERQRKAEEAKVQAEKEAAVSQQQGQLDEMQKQIAALAKGLQNRKADPELEAAKAELAKLRAEEAAAKAPTEVAPTPSQTFDQLAAEGSDDADVQAAVNDAKLEALKAETGASAGELEGLSDEGFHVDDDIADLESQEQLDELKALKALGDVMDAIGDSSIELSLEMETIANNDPVFKAALQIINDGEIRIGEEWIAAAKQLMKDINTEVTVATLKNIGIRLETSFQEAKTLAEAKIEDDDDDSILDGAAEDSAEASELMPSPTTSTAIGPEGSGPEREAVESVKLSEEKRAIVDLFYVTIANELELEPEVAAEFEAYKGDTSTETIIRIMRRPNGDEKNIAIGKSSDTPIDLYNKLKQVVAKAYYCQPAQITDEFLVDVVTNVQNVLKHAEKVAEEKEVTLKTQFTGGVNVELGSADPYTPESVPAFDQEATDPGVQQAPTSTERTTTSLRNPSHAINMARAMMDDNRFNTGEMEVLDLAEHIHYLANATGIIDNEEITQSFKAKGVLPQEAGSDVWASFAEKVEREYSDFDTGEIDATLLAQATNDPSIQDTQNLPGIAPSTRPTVETPADPDLLAAAAGPVPTNDGLGGATEQVPAAEVNAALLDQQAAEAEGASNDTLRDVTGGAGAIAGGAPVTSEGPVSVDDADVVSLDDYEIPANTPPALPGAAGLRDAALTIANLSSSQRGSLKDTNEIMSQLVDMLPANSTDTQVQEAIDTLMFNARTELDLDEAEDVLELVVQEALNEAGISIN